ncbi:ornithine cyclodeaminase family protein [Streptomyces sp. JJ66]|nr:ornithine cyclodeaminase family protein [Streptomyces sp. JJ66]
MLHEYGRDELMRRVIDRIAEGLAAVHTGAAELSPLRDGFNRAEPVPGIIEWMPHREPGNGVTVKTVAYSPGNPGRYGLPTILGTVARYDDLTGRLLAVADGVLLTALRTGAVTAVASRALARPDSATVGLIGTGAQAVTQLHALALEFPVRTVLAHDRDPAHLASFARRAAFLGLDVRPADPAHIARSCDIIVTATSTEVGAAPVLPDVPTREHLHVNAIGSDLIGKTELPPGLLHRALVVPDHPEQARREGECQQLTADHIGPELSRVCAEPERFAAARERLTVFDSTGIALEDHLALDVLTEAAVAIGAGTRLALEYHPSDLLDPYSPCSGADRRPGALLP